MILGGGALAYFAFTLPDTNQLTVAERRPSVTILADDGSTVATFGDLFGQPLTLKEMSPWLPKAVIATEDRRFYSHFGVDPVGLFRAAFANLRAGHDVQGGSTITQQLAKTVFLSPERSVSRKIREALLAVWLERHFTKEQILEIYLNRVYLGAGTYGVDAAAHRYFERALQSRPNDPGVRYQGAILDFSTGHLEQARQADRISKVGGTPAQPGHESER